MIKLVTFDLDNTLWEVDPVIIAAEQKMRRHLVELVADFDQRFSREVMLKLRNQVIEDQPEIRFDLSLTRERVLTLALQQCGFGLAAAETEAARAFTIFLDARHEVAPFKEAEPILAQLRNRYVIGALTNGNADVFRISIGRHFDFQHSSASVAASKPNPRMFQQALADCDVRPEEAVHVGDNPIDDIEGARAVGMHTVWVNLLPGTKAPIQDTPSVTSLNDLPEVIEALG